MTLTETLVEITGDAEVAEKVKSSLGKFMIPKGQFNEKLEELKNLETETKSIKAILAEKDADLEKIRTANMSEVEKLQHEFDRVSEDLARRDVENNKLSAKTVLTKAGLSEEHIENIVNTHVTEDADKSEQAIKLFVDILSNTKEQATQNTKDEIYKQDTKIDDEGGSPQVKGNLTLDKFKEMGWQERNEVFQNQPEVYEKLTETEKQ